MRRVFTICMLLAAVSLAAFGQDKVTGSFTVVVNPAQLTLTPAAGALAALTVGTAYSADIAISGGVSPYTVAVTSGALPSGISASVAGSNVVLSGTPTAICNPSPCTFVITVTDSAPAGLVKSSAVFSSGLGGEAKSEAYPTYPTYAPSTTITLVN
jgi:hypothetical protein